MKTYNLKRLFKCLLDLLYTIMHRINAPFYKTTPQATNVHFGHETAAYNLMIGQLNF